MIKSMKPDSNLDKAALSSSKKSDELIVKFMSLPWDSFLISFLAIVGALVAWQLLSYYQVNFILSFENVPTPVVVGEQFLNLIASEEFYKHIGASLQRIGIAFVMASFLGVIIGILMGRSKIFAGIMMPYIEILRPIPAVA